MYREEQWARYDDNVYVQVQFKADIRFSIYIV